MCTWLKAKLPVGETMDCLTDTHLPLLLASLDVAWGSMWIHGPFLLVFSIFCWGGEGRVGERSIPFEPILVKKA